jgi:hypothetical protein
LLGLLIWLWQNQGTSFQYFWILPNSISKICNDRK